MKAKISIDDCRFSACALFYPLYSYFLPDLVLFEGEIDEFINEKYGTGEIDGGNQEKGTIGKTTTFNMNKNYVGVTLPNH